MREVSHRLALGINGYLYDQTTNDFQHGVVVGDGNRVAISPLDLRFSFPSDTTRPWR